MNDGAESERGERETRSVWPDNRSMSKLFSMQAMFWVERLYSMDRYHRWSSIDGLQRVCVPTLQHSFIPRCFKKVGGFGAYRVRILYTLFHPRLTFSPIAFCVFFFFYYYVAASSARRLLTQLSPCISNIFLFSPFFHGFCVWVAEI